MITSVQVSSQPAVRIGDTERQRAAAGLADHLAAGRLTLDEYDERVQAAYAARTQADLLPLFADLPRTADRQQPRRRRRADRHGPSPLVLLLAMVLVAASVGLHVPLFPLIAVFWIRAAHRRHHGLRHRSYA